MSAKYQRMFAHCFFVENESAKSGVSHHRDHIIVYTCTCPWIRKFPQGLSPLC